MIDQFVLILLNVLNGLALALELLNVFPVFC